MPSSKALTNVHTGAGKLHSNVASAAADYQTSGGTEALLASMTTALNQQIAAPTSANVSGTGGATFVTLDASIYGPVWMGASGESVLDLFDLVVGSGEVRVSDTNLLPIYVTSVSGASVGSSTFTANLLTINLSGALPGSGTYKVLFSKRMTLGSFIPGVLATTRRFVPEPATLETQLYDIKWDISGIGGWGDAPATTLREAALSGLNERYNRTRTLDAGATAGDGEGGLILRAGQALTVQSAGDQKSYTSVPPDPYWAHYKTTAGSPTRSSNTLASYDGGSGFVGILQQKVSPSVSENMGTGNMTLASRLDVIQRDVTAASIGTGAVKTKVDSLTTTGTAINPDAGTSDDARRTIRLGSADFFWENTSGNDLSEVAIGHDMIEMTLATGEVYTYVITTLFGGPHPSSPVPAEDQRRALVRDLSGGLPNFPSGAATTGMKFRFVKTKHFEGVGAQHLREVLDGQTDPVRLGYGYHAVTPPLTSDPRPSGSNEINPGHPEFYARSRTRRSLIGTESPYALAWGGFNAREHVQELRGYLRGDGAVECTLVNKRTFIQDYPTNGSFLLTWHPALEGSTLFVTTSHASSSVALTLALDTDYISWAAKEGDEITIITMDTNSSNRQLIMTWPASFIFSGVEGDMPNYPDSGPTFSKYHGIYLGSSFGWLMTVTSYLGPGA